MSIHEVLFLCITHTNTHTPVFWYGEEVSHDAMAHLLFNGKNVKHANFLCMKYEMYACRMSIVNCRFRNSVLLT